MATYPWRLKVQRLDLVVAYLRLIEVERQDVSIVTGERPPDPGRETFLLANLQRVRIEIKGGKHAISQTVSVRSGSFTTN